MAKKSIPKNKAEKTRSPIVCPNCKEPALELTESECGMTIVHFWRWDPEEEHYHEFFKEEHSEDAPPIELVCSKCQLDMDAANQEGLYGQFRELME